MNPSLDRLTTQLTAILPFEAEVDNLRALVRFLYRVIVVLAVLLAIALAGWQYAQRHLTIVVPPDLTSGATLHRGQIPAESVFAFTFYIYQQLQRWPKSGAEDYPARIQRLAPYLTPGFRAELTLDAERRGPRLRDRTRYVLATPGFAYSPDHVHPLGGAIGGNAWNVDLDLTEAEYVTGERIKDVSYRYTLRVVAMDADPELNPWGLALDGYVTPPTLVAESSR